MSIISEVGGFIVYGTFVSTEEFLQRYMKLEDDLNDAVDVLEELEDEDDPRTYPIIKKVLAKIKGET
jgi:chaperonin cofactor prefoldin